MAKLDEAIIAAVPVDLGRVTAGSITSDQIIALRLVPGLANHDKALCSVALNEFGAVPRGTVRYAKLAIALLVNDAYERVRREREGG